MPLTVQIITTPSGERLVVLPEVDGELLVAAAEDAADVAAMQVFRRKLAAGEEELVPAEVVDQILGGENRVRVWRSHRGLTLSALAEAAEVEPSCLAEIEAGTRDGTLDVQSRLAAALGVSHDEITG